MYDALRPSVARPIMPIQSPSKMLRRLAKSAKKPEGKLATPAAKVRAEASVPACARLNPNDAVISGRITAITPLKRCSVICAAEFAANRPHVVKGALNTEVVSALDTAFHR